MPRKHEIAWELYQKNHSFRETAREMGSTIKAAYQNIFYHRHRGNKPKNSKIWGVIEQNPSITSKELARAVGRSERTVRDYIREYRARHGIQHVSRQAYCVQLILERPWLSRQELSGILKVSTNTISQFVAQESRRRNIQHLPALCLFWLYPLEQRVLHYWWLGKTMYEISKLAQVYSIKRTFAVRERICRKFQLTGTTASEQMTDFKKRYGEEYVRYLSGKRASPH